MPSINSNHAHSAVVLHAAQQLVIETISAAPLKNDEVQIAPRATGICGTDQHYYQNGRNSIYEITEPLVLGHEAAGEVVAVGADVTSIKVGDRVAIEPQQACLSCRHCLGGQYNLCPRMRFNGSASAKPPVQGSLQERINHPASLVYKLPDEVSYDEGAMIEPLSVAIHSVRMAELKPGQSVVIAGAGAVGLLCAAMAKVSGATTIAILDVDEARLEFARREGFADLTFTRLPTHDAARLQFDAAFECTGVEACLNACIECTIAGGRVIVVGLGRPVQAISLGVAVVREIKIFGVWRYVNTFPTAIDLLAAKKLDIKKLVTHRFGLLETEKALKLVIEKPADLIKCMIISDK